MRKILSQLPEGSKFKFSHLGRTWIVKSKTSDDVLVEREDDGYQWNVSPKHIIVL